MQYIGYYKDKKFLFILMDERKGDIVLGGMECKVVEIGVVKEVIFAGIDSAPFYDWYNELQEFRSYGGFQSNMHPKAKEIIDSGFDLNKYNINSNGVWTAS